ncbi:MAG: hypothetical protein ACYTEL_15600 [Planctomycetota bacterium]|jgi:prepilin-type processing-associated H-X9-DG protein
MKPKRIIAKKDLVVALFCAVFLLAGLGAVGASGRRRAMEAACRSNLIKWGLVGKLWADDHAGYFLERHQAVLWFGSLWAYHKNARMLLCPEARKTYAQGARNPFMAWEDWRDIDSDGMYEHFVGSYAANLWTASVGGIDEYWGGPYAPGAADAPFLVGGQTTNLEPHPEDEPAPYEQDLWTPGPMHEMRRACINRHMGVNVVFLDGSVRKVGLKHLWRLKWHRNWPPDAPLPAWPAWMQSFKNP